MSTEQNKTIIRIWLKQIDQQDWDGVQEVLSPDFTYHIVQSFGQPQDRKGTIAMMKGMETQHEIQDQIAEGNKVVTRGMLHAKLVAEFQGLPPGQEASVPYIEIEQVEDGQITEGWSSMDTLSIMQQVGSV